MIMRRPALEAFAQSIRVAYSVENMVDPIPRDAEISLNPSGCGGGFTFLVSTPFRIRRRRVDRARSG